MNVDIMHSIALTPEMENFIRERIATGKNGSINEVVQDALRLLAYQEHEAGSAFQSLREKLQRAATQAERGEMVDGEVFMNRLVSSLEGKTDKTSAA